MKKSRLAAFGIIVATIIAVIIAFASDIRNSMTLGLDLQGGFEILYQVTPLEGQEMPDMEAVVSSVRKRVDVLGVSEPEITVEGNDRIRVLPGRCRQSGSGAPHHLLDGQSDLSRCQRQSADGRQRAGRGGRQRRTGSVWQLCRQSQSEGFGHVLSGDQ